MDFSKGSLLSCSEKGGWECLLFNYMLQGLAASLL